MLPGQWVLGTPCGLCPDGCAQNTSNERLPRGICDQMAKTTAICSFLHSFRAVTLLQAPSGCTTGETSFQYPWPYPFGHDPDLGCYQPALLAVKKSAWPAMNVVVYDEHIPPAGTTFHPDSVHKHGDHRLLDASRVGILVSCWRPISYPHRLTPSKMSSFLRTPPK